MTNLKQELPMSVVLRDRSEMNSLNRESSIDASYQVSVHLAKKLQRRFLEIAQPETRIAYGGHVFIGSETKLATIKRTFHWYFLLKSFSSFGQAVSEKKIQIEKLTDGPRTTNT